MAALKRAFEQFWESGVIATKPNEYFEKIIRNHPGFFQFALKTSLKNGKLSYLSEVVFRGLLPIYWQSIYITDLEKQLIVQILFENSSSSKFEAIGRCKASMCSLIGSDFCLLSWERLVQHFDESETIKLKEFLLEIDGFLEVIPHIDDKLFGILDLLYKVIVSPSVF